MGAKKKPEWSGIKALGRVIIVAIAKEGGVVPSAFMDGRGGKRPVKALHRRGLVTVEPHSGVDSTNIYRLTEKGWTVAYALITAAAADGGRIPLPKDKGGGRPKDVLARLAVTGKAPRARRSFTVPRVKVRPNPPPVLPLRPGKPEEDLLVETPASPAPKVYLSVPESVLPPKDPGRLSITEAERYSRGVLHGKAVAMEEAAKKADAAAFLFPEAEAALKVLVTAFTHEAARLNEVAMRGEG